MDKINEESTNSVLNGGAADGLPNDGTGVVKLDPWLSPFKESLKSRYAKAQDWIKKIDETEGGLEKFSRVNISKQFLQARADRCSGNREVWIKCG